MQRSCEVCSKPFEAKRSHARTCSSSCRGRLAKAGGKVTPLPVAPSDSGPSLSGVTRRRLEETVRLDTDLGQLAMTLAIRIEHAATDSGASVASLSKEYRSVMAAALEGVSAKADPLDEFTKRLNAKRNAG